MFHVHVVEACVSLTGSVAFSTDCVVGVICFVCVLPMCLLPVLCDMYIVCVFYRWHCSHTDGVCYRCYCCWSVSLVSYCCGVGYCCVRFRFTFHLGGFTI